jgi:hypothetical protein
MKPINVPTALKQVKNYKSVASKVMFLECLKNHPIHPFIIEAITYYVDLACSGKITDKQMIGYIDEVCVEFANRFKK